MTTPLPEGVFSHAFIGPTCEVFCHPFTAGETVAQGKLGALRVNGVRASAQVVDVMGNGDYLLRIRVGE